MHLNHPGRVSNREHYSEHITMVGLRRQWGDEETVVEKMQKQRSEWLRTPCVHALSKDTKVSTVWMVVPVILQDGGA